MNTIKHAYLPHIYHRHDHRNIFYNIELYTDSVGYSRVQLFFRNVSWQFFFSCRFYRDDELNGKNKDSYAGRWQSICADKDFFQCLCTYKSLVMCLPINWEDAPTPRQFFKRSLTSTKKYYKCLEFKGLRQPF